MNDSEAEQRHGVGFRSDWIETGGGLGIGARVFTFPME